MRGALGQPQAQFLSAGALLVRIDADTPFFPLIYNEDWLFLLGYGVRAGRRARMAVAGEVGQEPYDPYAPDRAQSEEFGDILAEGWATRAESGPEFWSTQASYWHQAFKQRKRLCEDLRVRIAALPGPESGQMLDALDGAARVQRALGK